MVERITAASDVTSVMHSCTIPRDRCCHVIFGVTAVRHHTSLFTRAHTCTLLQSKHNTANTIRVGSVVSHASMVVHSCVRKKALTVSHHHCYYTRVHAQQCVGCSESGIVQRIIRARCACSVAHAITRKRPERNHRLNGNRSTYMYNRSSISSLPTTGNAPPTFLLLRQVSKVSIAKLLQMHAERLLHAGE